jgi:hypothetical protein
MLGRTSGTPRRRERSDPAQLAASERIKAGKDAAGRWRFDVRPFVNGKGGLT